MTNAQDFRKAAQGVTSDLIPDLEALLDQAEHMRRQIASMAASRRFDNPAGIPGHSQAREQRRASQIQLAANVRHSVRRAHDNAAGRRNSIRAVCSEPDLAPGGQQRRDLEVRRYGATLIEMSDDRLTQEAQKLIASVTSHEYDLAAVVAEELTHRGMGALATKIQDAVWAARRSYLTDPRYVTSCDVIARTDAWLANADQADPELIVYNNDVEYRVRVSELLEADPAPAPAPTARKAPRSAAPKTPGPGMIDHFVAGPPLKR
jgi:hypothetical protein